MQHPQLSRKLLTNLTTWLAVALFVVLALAVSACGFASASEATPAASLTATSTPTPSQTSTPTPTFIPTPTPTPTPTPSPRERRTGATNIVKIWSSDITLSANVVPVSFVNGQWQVASYAAGWNDNSALPGEGDNIVLSGHNNWKGEVFRYLEYLQPGHKIFLGTADGRTWTYEVFSVYKVLETGVSREESIEHAKVMDQTGTEQLTLITCWPYTTYTHRLIVLARPVQ
jgi:sortase A